MIDATIAEAAKESKAINGAQKGFTNVLNG
jgi:hypothetical protein